MELLRSATGAWNEDYYLANSNNLEIERTLAAQQYTLNRTLSTRAQEVLEKERSILFEQALPEDNLPRVVDVDFDDESINVEEYMRKRVALIQETRKDHFSAGIQLQRIDISAEKKLIKLRDELYEEDQSIITGFFFDKYQKLQKSRLYEALKIMPKPAVHHCHLTAAAPIDYLIRLTYYDFVYYNDREQLFKVSRNGITLDGYQKVTTLRKYWSNSITFDNYIKQKILMTRDQCACQESHTIWQAFQPKFMLTYDLYNHYEFFEKILFKVCKVFIKEMVFVLELRHIFGMVIDDNGNPIGVPEEIKIFKRVLDKIKRDYPLFTVRLIICGLKIIGHDHCLKMMKATTEAQYLSELVVGWDMVNEEDAFAPLIEYVKMIKEYQGHTDVDVVLHGKNNIQQAKYFIAGESCDRSNTNVIDAVLLGTKRIGHGFGLAKHPHLQEIVKKQNICIECCPVSNIILGYTLDLRCHPVRAFLHQGLPVSISPDDPGFFDAEGVTLDYVYAFMAWELDLADLKQLCINSLNYSLITDEEKEKIRPFFEERWIRFLEFVRGKF